jgi:hypothetical protein
MALIAFCIGIILEIALGAAYCIVLGTATMLAIVIVAPLAIVAESFLCLADLVRPAPPPHL